MADFSWWLEVKRGAVAVTALERDALHIYTALAVQFITVAATRWRLDQWRTLLPLLLLEMANEAADLLYEIWPPDDRARQWWASVHDVANTMAVPIVIVLVARRLRRP